MTPSYSQAGEPAGAEPAWTADRFLEYWGVPASRPGALPSSAKRFPDGAQYRIEIPSTEGTACLDAVLDAAREFGVPVHRVSQGSGVFMLTDAELARIADTAAAARVEVSLFARPNASWVNSTMAASPAGLVAGSLARGRDQLRQVLDDVDLADLAAIRAAVDVPIDLYVESPDNIGGLVRHHEIPEFVRVGAPVYLKFGLRNAPDLYPTGLHLEPVATAMSRERVRRARLGLELLARSGYTPAISELGAAGLAVPSPEPGLHPPTWSVSGVGAHAA